MFFGYRFVSNCSQIMKGSRSIKIDVGSNVQQGIARFRIYHNITPYYDSCESTVTIRWQQKLLGLRITTKYGYGRHIRKWLFDSKVHHPFDYYENVNSYLTGWNIFRYVDLHIYQRDMFEWRLHGMVLKSCQKNWQPTGYPM